MDGVLLRGKDGNWWVREGRRVRAGDEVVVGLAEDGSEGVLVHARGFVSDRGVDGDFHFMSSQSRVRSQSTTVRSPGCWWPRSDAVGTCCG